MKRYPHLKNAPITEALIDFRVVLPADATLTHLRELGQKISATYPNVKDFYKIQAEIIIDRSQSATSSREQIGYQYTSKDGINVFLATVEGFTFSQLKPYKTWEDLKAKGLGLWDEYQEAIRPESITRIALRYVNRLELPLDLRDFKDYLTAPPDVPPKLRQTLSSFLTRIVIPIEKVGALAIITQQYNYVAEGNITPVILDIDVRNTGEFSGDGREAWEVADMLRAEKNKIFFESITERMEELCQ